MMTRRSMLSLAATLGSGLVLRRSSPALQSGAGLTQVDLDAKRGWLPLANGQADRMGKCCPAIRGLHIEQVPLVRIASEVDRVESARVIDGDLRL